MSFKLTPVATALGILGLMTTPVWAADANDHISSQQEVIKKLTARTGELEAELREMKKEIHQLKVAEKSNKNSVDQKVKKQSEKNSPPVIHTFQSDSSGNKEVNKPSIYFIGRNEPLYLTGPAIVSSPYIGEYPQYNGSDLIVNFPSVNLDLNILKQRNRLNGYYKDHNISPPEALIDLSGRAEGQIVSTHPYAGGHKSNIDLSGAELDVAAMVNRWSLGYFSMVYDNSQPPNSVSRFSNSRLFIDKGFVTFGDLGQEPFYATIGQFYVPFGQYSTLMISDSLPKVLGRIKARALQLGYSKQFDSVNGLNAAVYAFRGDSKTSQNSSKINNYGASIDYTIKQDKWNGNLAAGYVMNIADSLGMQNNGASTGYDGFDSSDNVLYHRVPGLDVHGSVVVGPVTLIAEYVSAVKAFSPMDLTYNSSGAKPQAIHIEGVYEFSMWGKPSLIAIGYDTTKDALALLLPRQRYIATVSTSVWKDTIQSLEFRHDINYGASNTATGKGIAISPSGLGHSSDTVTFQVGVYF